jgi:hypothetical protein
LALAADSSQWEGPMLLTLFAVMLVLWILGVATGAFAGMVHFLLAGAILMLVLEVADRRRPAL